MRRIDLNDWEVNGGGAFGTSYFHKRDSTLMLKMMRTDADLGLVERELSNARLACSMGIPTPEPGELVTDGERAGLIFRRIVGKSSYAKAVGSTPERIPELAREYAGMMRLMHSTPGSAGMYGVNEVYGDYIRQNVFRTDEEKRKALDFLESVPQTYTCLHGDMHFGNVIFSESGRFFIDMADFCCGNPTFDMAMMQLLVMYSCHYEKPFFKEFHCTSDQACRFWNLVLREYYGTDITQEELLNTSLPFIAVRAIVVETLWKAPLYPPLDSVIFPAFMQCR